MSGYWPRLIVCIVLLVGAPLAHGDESPAPVVDLSEWDVGADPARELREGWTVRRGSTGASPLPATVPQSWPATLAGGERLPRFGEAWYEIRLRLPASDGPLALRLRSFQAAVAVYANGQRLAQRGRPGDARNEVPDTRPLLVRIPSSDTEITLTLHISNHFHGAGGLREVVVIGDQAWLEQRQRLTDMLMAALIGGLLLLAVYLLALYPRKRVAGGLWLAALLGVVALRIAAVSHFLEFVPGAGSSVTQRVAYLTVFLTGPLVFLLLRSLYPNDLQRFAGWLIGAFGLAGVAACLTLSVPNFTRLQSPVAFVVMVMAAYFVWRVVVAVRRRRPGARLIAAGTAVMAAAVSNDALLYAGVLETVNLIAPGMLVFLAAHAFVLGGRVLDTLTDNELLNARLAALNRNLERSVSARTRDLLSQSDLLITTLESMEPALLAINGQGRVVAFNQAFLALFGLSRSEVKGSTRDHLREVMAERNSALAGDDGEAGLLPPPGAMQAGHSDLHLSNGEVIEISRRPTATGGYVSTFQDVTAQRVAELGPEGGAVGIWDRNLRIGRLTCSDRYWSMLGFNPQAVPPDIMHRHIADWLSVIHPDDRRMADAVMEQGRRGDMPLLFNCRIQTREADWLWVTVRGQVIRDDRGVPVRMVGTQTDIDAIVRAQEAMREARDFAEADARHKSHFLASLSHELRTPLHGMLGNLQLLEAETRGDRRKRVQAILRAGHSLLQLMDAILESARAEAGRLRVREENFSPRHLLNEVVELMEPLASQKGVDLVVDVDERVPPWLLGGQVQLRQILMNLIGNAVKFTDQGRISLTVTRRGNDRYTFAVADTGRGMTSASLKRIYEEYYQDDPSAEAGAGLGLFIVRRLAEALAGELEARSSPGEGSCFQLTLALSAGDPADVAHKPQQAPGPFRLLLVEDVAVNRVMTSELLSRDGHLVTPVSSGELALEALAGNRFDAVLMDIRLQGMDGVETTRRIRALQDPMAQAVPVIALTANADEVDAAFRLAAGIDAVSPKPIRLPDLYRKLDALCNRGRETDVTIAPERQAARPDSDRLCELLDVVGRTRLRTLMFQLEETFIGQQVRVTDSMALGDREGLAAAAHRLEGAAANFGFDAVERASRAVRKADADDMVAAVDGLQRALNDALPAIQEWVSRLTDAGDNGESMEVGEV